MKLLQSGWMIIVIGTLLYWGVTAALLMKFDPPPMTATASTETEAYVFETKPSWDFVNPELDRLVLELKSQKEQLKTQREDLQAWEARLMAEQAEIQQITQKVHRLQIEFEKNYLQIKNEEAANLKKVAKLFSSMAPETTVSLFAEMPDDEVVKYLSLMKDADSATILETLALQGETQTRRVTMLTDRLQAALYRSSQTNQTSPKP